MFRDMLKYKSDKKGKHYIVADPFFASSKLCSCCGHKKDNLKLSDRVYECESCHTKIDRDYNAGINLKQYGIQVLAELGVLVKATCFFVICICFSSGRNAANSRLVTWGVGSVVDRVIIEIKHAFSTGFFEAPTSKSVRI